MAAMTPRHMSVVKDARVEPLATMSPNGGRFAEGRMAKEHNWGHVRPVAPPSPGVAKRAIGTLWSRSLGRTRKQ